MDEEMFTVSITRREFLCLPIEARQRILKQQAEEINSESTIQQRMNVIENILTDYFANNYHNIVGGFDLCQNYIKLIKNDDK